MFVNCNAKKLTKVEKSKQVKEKLAKKRKKEYERSRKKAIKKHIDMQPDKTQETMKLYKNMSNDWNKKSFSNNSNFFIRCKHFIVNVFKKKDNPDKGLFDKKTKNRKKSNIFKKILNKKKK
ncbi:MAG: hypothetical protein U9R54_00575 [Bacteroidota bacterium]|nr:hypothetical protein [Bacteroidota bacterium]